MLLEEYISEHEYKRNEIVRGIKVKFKSLNGKNGKVMSATNIEDGKAFILQGSLDNYHRFHNWEGKTAVADLLPIRGKTEVDKQIFPLARIRTTVKYAEKQSKSLEDDKDKENKSEIVF